MTNKPKVPTIIGVVFLTLGVAIGVFLIQSQQSFRLGASPGSTPKNVRITNISDSSFTVSWITDKKTVGYLKWDTDTNKLDNTSAQKDSVLSNTHSITLNGLEPSSEYFFNIFSDDTQYNNNNLSWNANTGPTMGSTKSINISGNVLTASGSPANDSLVYISLANAVPVSTTTSSEGNWFVNISNARTSDLASFVDIDSENTLLEISVQALSGSATAQIYPRAANPVPPIILGQTHDFRDAVSSDDLTSPDASLDLPADEDSNESGFDLTDDNEKKGTNIVTLENVDSNEVIFTTTPEFFGEGPVGAKLSITIESDPVTETVTVNSLGNWKWSPPEGLEEGEHNVTIAWTDENGFLRKLTKKFIVQAAEGPSFESTPSATPSVAQTPTPTLGPSITPTSTPTPIPTDAPIPESGTPTPTLLLAFMGIASLATSLFFWQKTK